MVAARPLHLPEQADVDGPPLELAPRAEAHAAPEAGRADAPDERARVADAIRRVVRDHPTILAELAK